MTSPNSEKWYIVWNNERIPVAAFKCPLIAAHWASVNGGTLDPDDTLTTSPREVSFDGVKGYHSVAEKRTQDEILGIKES